MKHFHIHAVWNMQMIHIFRSRVSGERPEKSPFSNIGQNIDDRNGLKERLGGARKRNLRRGSYSYGALKFRTNCKSTRAGKL